MRTPKRNPSADWFGMLAVLSALVMVFIGSRPCAAQSFRDALGLAYTYNPQLAAGRAMLRQADEGVPQALSGWRPQVSVTGNLGRSVVSDSVVKADPQHRIPQVAMLSAQQPVYTGGKVPAQVHQAEARVLAQRAQLRATESTVLLAAGSAYLDVARDQRTVGLNRTNKALLDRTLHAAEQQAVVGDITLADVAQARARDEDGRAQLAAAETQLAASRASYEQQVGSLPGSLDLPHLDLPLPRSREAAIAQALAGNFAVRSARETYAASQAGVDVTRAGLLPTVSILAYVAHLKETDVQMLHQRDNLAEAEVMVQWPIYPGGEVSAEVRAAKEATSVSRLQIDVALRDAKRQAASAWDALEASAVQVSAARGSVAANEVATRGVVRQQGVGARTLLDVLNAQQELFGANVRTVTAEHDRLLAALQLLSAVGGLGAQELALPVTVYDPVRHYDETRGRWYGTDQAP